MKIIETALPDVKVIEPKVFGDSRGYFLETFREERYREVGIRDPFVQDNVSFSEHGVLRGLHLQNPHSQGKLIYVLRGEVFDVVVDVRRGSPHFGKWVGVTLSATNAKQLYVPPGFAHGFCVTGDCALFAYKCTDYYYPECEFSIQWNDPSIGVEWPILDPCLSQKDVNGRPLKDVPLDKLLVYQPEN